MLDWAAMQFLLESVKRNRRRLRIEELILLALRCLMVFLLASTLARLTGCATLNALPVGSESQTAVFVIDDSCSMGQRVGGGTLFSAGTTDVVDQIGELGDTDKLAIILTSAESGDEPFFNLTHMANAQRDDLAARLGGLEASDSRARLDRALLSAARVFAEDKSINRRLYVYGDFRQVDLDVSADADAISKACDALRKLNVEIVALDYGREPVGNLTIESLSLLDRFVVAKAPMRFRAEVRNNSDRMARNVEVKLKAKLPTPDGPREVELPAVVIGSIDSRSVGQVEFTVTFQMGGAATITAALPPDELPADSEVCLAIDVREAVRVLVVDGHFDVADPSASESNLFTLMLDPDLNGSEGTKVDIISPPALGDTDLEDYDLVALLNVSDLPISMDANGQAVWPAVTACERFVRDGGGMIIFTGNRVNPTFYNGPMYAGGSGLSPFRVGQRKGNPDRRKQYFRLDPRSIAADGVTQIFRDYLAAGVDPTRFVRFYAFTASRGSAPLSAAADIKPPRILARFTDQDSSPAVVSRQFGRGTTLMFYTSATNAWNDWFADENGTLNVMLNDAVRLLAKGQMNSLSAAVGEPMVYSLAPDLRDATAELKTPLHPTQPVVSLTATTTTAPGGRAGRMRLRYDRAVTAGAYSLDLSLPDGSVRHVFFSRRVDPVEGDLTLGGKSAVTAAFGQEGVTYIERREPQASGLAESEARKEYWMWALAVLVALMALETYLAQRFGHWAGSGKARTTTKQAQA